MTLEERAEKLYEDLNSEPMPNKNLSLAMIRKSLKEQDRDTRHACAEAVTMIDDRHLVMEHNRPLTTIEISLTHSAVMNCREGVK